MDDSDFSENIDEKNELIVKSIELVQKAHYNLSQPELLAYSYILSKIDTTQPSFSDITFTYSDIVAALDITDGGWQRHYINETLKSLRDRSFWFWNKVNNVEMTIGLIDSVQIDRDDGTIHIKMDDKLIPYLLQVQKKVEYPFWYSQGMSEYCIPLYELLKSYLEPGQFTIDLLKLRTQMNVKIQKYKAYTELRRNVLEKVLDQINNITDITASMEPIKVKKVVKGIRFTVSLKNQAEAEPVIDEEKPKKPRQKSKQQVVESE